MNSSVSTVVSVLIVDDDDLDVMLTKRVLAKCPEFAIVDSVSAADEALQRFENHADWLRDAADRHPPTLILLDINMPRMNGLEFLERFAANVSTWTGQEQPSSVVMLTTSDDPRDRARAMQFDCVVDYLPKPLTIEAARRLAELVTAR